MLAQLLDEQLLGHAFRPLIDRLQRHKELGQERAIRIGPLIAAALLREHRPNRRVALDDVADARNRFHAGLQIDGRRHDGANPHIALFELGQEFGAKPRREDAGGHEEGERRQRRNPVVPNRHEQDRLVDLADQPHDDGLDLLHLVGQQDRRQDRRHREGGDHRADQRIRISPRHRAEDLALHALHGEQRKKRRDGDDHREEDRPIDFNRGREDTVKLVRGCRAFGLVRRMFVREVTEDVLHHNHGGIDDDAKVDRPDRQQIGGLRRGLP